MGLRRDMVRLLLPALLLWACSDDQQTGKEVNHPCDTNSDCADGICHSGVCASSSPKSNGQSCKGRGECKSLNCVGYKCVPGNQLAQADCINDEECKSRECVNGKCKGKLQPDAGADSAPPDKGKPDAPAPDKASADAPVPDQAKPDLVVPDLPIPDLPAPDMSLCGNGKLDSPKEECDKTVPAVITCKTKGFTDGKLTCRTDCTVSTLDCHQVEDPSGIKITPSNGSAFPRTASDGKDFLVAWKLGNTIYAARVSAAGKLLDKSPIKLGVNGDGYHKYHIAVAYGGGNYLVAWNGGSHLVARRVTPQGKALDGLGIPINPPNYGGHSPDIAFDGTNFVVVWYDERLKLGNHIYAARISSAGVLLDKKSVRVDQSTMKRSNPAVAFDGTNFLVVFQGEAKGYVTEIWGNRLSTSLAVLHKTDITVGSGPNHQLFPDVTFGKSSYLVVWQDERNAPHFIGGARVAKSGTVLDPNGLLLGQQSTTSKYPSVAHDGSHFMLTWWVDGFRTIKTRMVGHRIDGLGKSLDSTFVISTLTPRGLAFQQALAHGGGRYLVLWCDVTAGPWSGSLTGARVRFGKP